MYKVFIENKLIIFQINSHLITPLKRKAIKEKIRDFLQSDGKELTIEVRGKSSFHEVFEGYKHIEAAGGLVERNNKFMFIKRHGVWDIPKGKMEYDETPEAAAVREIEEECGISAPKVKLHLTNTWHTYKQKNKKILKKTYWYWLDDNDDPMEPVPQEEEGITEVRFLGWDEIDLVESNTYASISEVIRSLKNKLK
jgi:8-oxo-dGTP pyrophosphatase MutT (NUDIX family)